MTPDDKLENSYFKGWYRKNYGTWPGEYGEPLSSIVARVCDAQAEYIDLKVKELHDAIKQSI